MISRSMDMVSAWRSARLPANGGLPRCTPNISVPKYGATRSCEPSCAASRDWSLGLTLSTTSRSPAR